MKMCLLTTLPKLILETGFISVYIFSPPELDESWGDGIIGVPGPG